MALVRTLGDASHSPVRQGKDCLLAPARPRLYVDREAREGMRNSLHKMRRNAIITE